MQPLKHLLPAVVLASGFGFAASASTLPPASLADALSTSLAAFNVYTTPAGATFQGAPGLLASETDIVTPLTKVTFDPDGVAVVPSVPLPASAGFLLLGVAAFAMRRKKS